MRNYLTILAGLMLVSCGGAKGCGARYSPSPITIHQDFYYLELGELTPDKIQDGIMVIEATMPESEKARLANFWQDAEATGNVRDDQIQFVHLRGYLEHEDYLHRDFVYGSPIYDYSPYICSEVRLFTDNTHFLDFEQGLPFAIGTIGTHNNRVQNYQDGSSATEQNEYHNPSGYATSPVPVLGIESEEFYKGNFKVRVEIGTSITPDNIPQGRFFLRLYLRMSITRNGQVYLGNYAPQTPPCGPYAPKVPDASADMADTPTDAGDAASDMNTPDVPSDLSGDASDMSVVDETTDIDDTSADVPIDL